MTLKRIQKMRLQLLTAQTKLTKAIIEVSNLGKEIERDRTKGTLTKFQEETYETEKRFLDSTLVAIEKMHKYLDEQEKNLTTG